MKYIVNAFTLAIFLASLLSLPLAAQHLPTSFHEYTSSCGAIAIFPGQITDLPSVPGGGPGGEGLYGPGHTPPGWNQPPGVVNCFCWELDSQGGSVDGHAYQCAAPGENGCGSDAFCNSSCVPIPHADNNNDGVPWPADMEEDNPFPNSPMFDSDGDSIPDAYDLMPNGNDPNAEGFTLNPAGLIPQYTTRGAFLSMLAGLGLIPDSTNRFTAQELNVMFGDSDGDGVVTMADALSDQYTFIAELVLQLSDATLEIPGLERIRRTEVLSATANALIVGLHFAAPELLDGELGKYLKKIVSAANASVDRMVLSFNGNEMVLDEYGNTQVSLSIVTGPDGADQVVIKFYGENGEVIELQGVELGSGNRSLQDWLKTTTGDPVNTATGDFVHEETDLDYIGRGLPLNIRRVYRSRSLYHGILGPNWSMPLLETRAVIWPKGEAIYVLWGDGTSSQFSYSPDLGLWVGVGGDYGKIRIGHDGGDPDSDVMPPSLILRRPDGTQYYFCPMGWVAGLPHGAVTNLRKFSDPDGNALIFRRDEKGRVRQIIDTLGQVLDLQYDDERDLLIEVRDWRQRAVTYIYDDEKGHLLEVLLPETPFMQAGGALAQGRPGSIYEYWEHPDGWEQNKDLVLNHNLKSIRRRGSQLPYIQLEYYTELGYQYDRVWYHIVDDLLTEYRYLSIGTGTTEGPDAWQPNDADHRTEVLYPEGQRQNFVHGNGLLLRKEVLNGRFGTDWSLQGDVYVDPDEGVTHSVWSTVLTYDSGERLISQLETTDVLYPDGRFIELVYDHHNPDRFQQRNVTRVTEHPYPPVPEMESRVVEYLYDPVTTEARVAVDALDREWERVYGHQEMTYSQARAWRNLGIWWVLPDDPPQALQILFGQGDANGDGSLGGVSKVVLFREPAVTVAAPEGPHVPSSEVTPETRIKYDSAGQMSGMANPDGTHIHLAYSNGLLTKVTEDAGGLNKETIFRRDSMGRLEKRVEGDKRALEVSYDGRGLPTALIWKPRPAGQAFPLPVGIEYVPIGNPLQEEHKDIVQQVFYDLQGRLIATKPRFYTGGGGGQPSQTVYPPIVQELQYSVDGRLTGRTVGLFSGPNYSAEGIGSWIYEVDSEGRIRSETWPSGARIVNTFDSRGLTLSISRSLGSGPGLGHSVFHYNAFGEKTRDEDAEGRTTIFLRDGYGRLHEAIHPSGSVESFVLDAADRVLVEEHKHNGDVIMRRELEYDNWNRLLREELHDFEVGADGVSPGAPAIIENLYGWGIAREDLRWTSTGAGTTKERVRYVRDTLGRVKEVHHGIPALLSEVSVLDIEGRPLSTTYVHDGRGAAGPISPSQTTYLWRYDRHGRRKLEVDPEGNTSQWAYGANSLPTVHKDREGRELRSTYNTLDKVVSLLEIAPGATTRIEHAEFSIWGGLLTNVDARGNRTEYTYDPLNRPTKRRMADGTEYKFTSYDKTDRLLSEERPGGVAISFGYDAGGALNSVVASGAAASVARSLQNDAYGRPVRIQEAVTGRDQSVVCLWRNSQGILTKESQKIGATAARAHSMPRDGRGLPVAHHFPSGHVVTYAWDPVGRPLTVASSIAGVVATYDAHYGHSRYRRASLSSNVERRMEYDSNGRCLSFLDVSQQAGSLCGVQAYAYSPEGNLIARQRSDGLLESFVYDGFGRLTRWYYDHSEPEAWARDVIWSWDATDNLTNRWDSALGYSTQASPNILNQIPAFTPNISALDYSANGEEIARSETGVSRSWQWDALGRPYVSEYIHQGSVIAVEHTYDGFDRLIRRGDVLRGAARYVYADGILRELISDANGHSEFVEDWRRRGPFWRLVDGNSSQYYANDFTGNVLAIHGSGGLIEAYEYEPFGDVSHLGAGIPVSESSSGNDLFFLAEPHDLAVGVAFLGARLYDPQLSRFTSRDPLGEMPGLNLYAYAKASPFRWSDPSGRAPEENQEPTVPGTRPNIMIDRVMGELLLWDCPFEMIDNYVYGAEESAGGDWGDRRFRELSPNQMLRTLGFMISEQAQWAGTHEAIDRSLSWAASGVASILYDTYVAPALQVAAVALDIPGTLAETGLRAAGASEGAAVAGGLLVGALTPSSWAGKGLKLANKGIGATRGVTAGAKAFHHTVEGAVESISRTGLRPGSYATPTAGLSPLQAHIELALNPAGGARNAVLQIDVAGLRAAGYEIPSVTRVASQFGMPGGGFEMRFPYAIPTEFIKVLP